MSSYKQNALAAAILSGLGVFGGMPSGPRSESQDARARIRRGYPQTGTGKRQGERIARQVRRSFGNPFAASDACLARIKERLAAKS